MSSFVISKEEYVKAAGVVAGIIERANEGTSRELFIWDYQRQRRMTTKDFYDCFVECYEMNALSVYDYYSQRHAGEELLTDSNKYTPEFEEYRKIGRRAVYDAGKLKEIIFNLRDFFRSVEYQTAETDAYYFKLKMIFNAILVEIMGLMYPHEVECWGEFTA